MKTRLGLHECSFMRQQPMRVGIEHLLGCLLHIGVRRHVTTPTIRPDVSVTGTACVYPG